MNLSSFQRLPLQQRLQVASDGESYKACDLTSIRGLLRHVVLIAIGYASVSIWRTTTGNMINEITTLTEDLRSSLVSEFENIGKYTYPKTNISTINLAKVIDSYLTKNNTDFTEIKTKIAPLLFQAYSVIPQVSQVSYVSKDGLMFSYITESNTSFAVFANSSSSYSSHGDYIWYTQTIDQRTGHLNGNATKISQPLDVTIKNWLQAAAQRNYTTAFVGNGLVGGDNETMFQNVVSLPSKKGVVSLGFPVKTLPNVVNSLNLHGEELYMWTMDGTVLVREGSLNASFFISNGSICFGRESQCIPENCTSTGGCKVEIEGSQFQVFCSVLEDSGVPLRYTLMFPNKGEVTHIMQKANLAIFLLIGVCLFFAFGWLGGFLLFMLHAQRRGMHMRAMLINQMEATQQAERKSMRKSQAFATASHDIRATLAGMTSMIDECRQEVQPSSEQDKSLEQVNVCIKYLTGLLNSVLDTSKIESGKMPLEEEEFNLAKLIEDVADFYHPMAMQKGVDVVLDLQDGSILKYWNVSGDSGKLKQILNNLVSNAVKFTVDGHISIRAWAQRPGSKSSLVLASEPPQGGVLKFIKSILGKNKNQTSSNYETEISNSIINNANTMEFVFEVDDTGKGIPMEMRKSVFENYVQVRETAQGQQGTGLGLGIVQSLVRLMGGEIRITDKAMGEKGTCFQFNVLLTTLEPPVNETKVRRDIETGGDQVSTPNLGLTVNTSLGGSMNIRNLSPRFNNFLSSSPKQECSQVVLLLKQEERRRVIEKYIKSEGIKVTLVEKWEHLSYALGRLFRSSPQSSMGRAECSLTSTTSLTDVPLIGTDDIDSINPTTRRRSNNFSPVVLLIIDAKTGPFAELYDIVKTFRRGLNLKITCKVVWLNDTSPHGNERGDISCSRPLHGSRLIQVLKMLPEFGETEQNETHVDELQQESLVRHSFVAEPSPKNTWCDANYEIQEVEPSTRFSKKLGKTIMVESDSLVKSMDTDRELIGTSKPRDNEFLKGKRVLVVDDLAITSSITTRKLKKMGASQVTQCNSGKEAVRLVSEWLTQRKQENSINMLFFDYIFMDCQMPEMDGYEATREIRKMEKNSGIHIPIIAVSGHDPASREARETIEAGMDAYLEKTLNQDQLANIIGEIESKMTRNATL